MNAYINYFAYSYLKNNVDSINNCIESYLEDGDSERCENPVVRPWVDEHGPELFKQVKFPEKKEDLRKELVADFEEKGNGAPRAFAKEVTTGKNNISGKQLSRNGCKFYADSIGYKWGGNSDDGNVKGCFVQHEPKTVYYNEKDSTTECGDVDGSTCLQGDNQYVDKENCAFYAGSIGYKWGGNSDDGNVKGCFVQHEPKTVYFNEKKTDTKCGDVDDSTCIQKKKSDLKEKNTKIKKTQKKIKETFINIPKKSNGLTYVILFILALVLYFKLKKK